MEKKNKDDMDWYTLQDIALCGECMLQSNYVPRDNYSHTATMGKCPRCGEEKYILPRRHWKKGGYNNEPVGYV